MRSNLFRVNLKNFSNEDTKWSSLTKLILESVGNVKFEMPVKVEVTFSCLLINKGVCTGSAACLICQVFMLETLPDTTPKGIFLAWLFTTVKIFGSRTKNGRKP